MEQQSSPTWNGIEILTDTAYLPFSHYAYLSNHGPLGPIAYGHSVEQAIERLIEQLEAELCECDSDDPSVGYVGTVCAFCRGERAYSQASELDADAWDAEWRESKKQPATVPALVGFGAPSKPASLACIGNGLFVRTGRTA
jgi:hypothetical protein